MSQLQLPNGDDHPEAAIKHLADAEVLLVEIDRHLDRRFGESWGGGDVRPPADSGRDLVDYLVEVGVFRSRADGRIDAPDLFLAGLGLKRKGGVRRK